MIRSILVSAAICLSGWVSTAVAGEVDVIKHIPYLGADRSEKMDAYLPKEKGERPRPVVIWIHGGGWVGGSKSAARELNICQTLAENGYAAFSIDYKLGQKSEGKEAKVTEVPWPQNIHDCKSAVRFVRKESARFGIDPSRIAISGGSAGAHLALVVGLTAEDAKLNEGGLYTDQSNAISCIIDFYGPTVIEGSRVGFFTGKTGEETAANAKIASPVHQVKKDSPPVLVAHGTADKTTDIAFSRDLVAKMKEVGTVHEYIEVPEAGHSFHFQPKQMDLRPVVLAFLGKYLGESR
mgnify:CR=1 FL=1